MYRKILAGLVIILGAYSSCDLFPKINCSDCTQSPPDSADLKMLVTINGENPKVPLIVYKGKVEDGNVEWVDTTDNQNFYLYVKMNQYYSVVASYKSGGRTIYAIDGNKITSQNEADYCNEDCYIVINNVLDVQLKNK